jgi:hypothetical protein
MPKLTLDDITAITANAAKDWKYESPVIRMGPPKRYIVTASKVGLAPWDWVDWLLVAGCAAVGVGLILWLATV